MLVVVNDLYAPTKSGTTFAEVIRRVTRVSDQGTVRLAPGWDWKMAVDGLVGARRRYEDDLGVLDGMTARIAVGEALWWIAAADDFLLQRVSCGMPKAEYYRELTKTAGGARLAGLVYARNRAGHQLAQLLTARVKIDSPPLTVLDADGSARTVQLQRYVHFGLKPSDVSPAEGYFFAADEHLPPPDPGFQERFGRDRCCADHLATKSVGEVLRAVQESLQHVMRWEERSENAIDVSIQMTEMPPDVKR